MTFVSSFMPINDSGIDPWQPLDEETLLGRDFIEMRKNGLGDDLKYRYREKWTELGAPQEWISLMSHTNPEEIYWFPDDFWVDLLCLTQIPNSMKLAVATKFRKNPPEKFKNLLNSVRELTGGPSFHGLNLIDQCHKLQISYIKKTPEEMVDEFPELKKYNKGSVEKFALNYYKMQGWSGESNEGKAINIFEGQVRKYCTDRNVYMHGYTKQIVFRRMPLLPRKIGEREKTLIREAVKYCFNDLNRTFNSASESSPFKKSASSSILPLELKDLSSTCREYGEEFLIKLCEHSMENLVHAGHPDLTIYKNGKISVVEVKQKNDKFTTRQPYWVRDKGQKLGFDISVLHISKSIKDLA